MVLAGYFGRFWDLTDSGASTLIKYRSNDACSGRDPTCNWLAYFAADSSITSSKRPALNLGAKQERDLDKAFWVYILDI